MTLPTSRALLLALQKSTYPKNIKYFRELTSKIDELTAQESELSSQITNTSKAIHAQPTSSQASTHSSDRKSNVVVYGVEECPPTRLEELISKEIQLLFPKFLEA